MRKKENQIFQTNSKWRWFAFKWSSRFLFIGILLISIIILLTLLKGIKPNLPLLIGDSDSAAPVLKPIIPNGLKKAELKKYKGFEAFLKMKEVNEKLQKRQSRIINKQIRAAFYVDWDPQSFFSLQKNIDKLNMVLPEWFFIDPITDTLLVNIDIPAYQVMKKKEVEIVPIINNINPKKGIGEFDGEMLHRILHNKSKKLRLINDIVKALKKYQLQGINIDFEDFKEDNDQFIIAFQKELYQKMHQENLIVTQDIMPNDEDFNVKSLGDFNDYIFLMAYDEHYSNSIPGDISSQQFIEKVLDETAKEISPDKIILGFAGYGYDWKNGVEAKNLTYQQALANAKQNKASIIFNNDTYNNNYSYKDVNGENHDVYFTDAATNYNTIRFADQYGTAGTALWRLGSEDERLWTFYDRSLTNNSLQKYPFDFATLTYVNTPVGRPDYIGDGEVLNVVTTPQPGKINLEIDSIEGIITEQKYLQLPTKYVIKKYGNVHNQVILTFDDGPDPEYTPKILDILKKEKVPATFFVIGMEAEDNLPILKRIFDEGHEIGNHTFTHPNIAIVSTDRAFTEMETTRLLIEAVIGRSTILFRAPYNADSEPINDIELKPIALSKNKNYYTIGESIDPEDWQPNISADTIFERTIRQYEINPSKGIILFHDAGGNRQATVDALPRIIAYFKSKGVSFTTVASILHTSKDVIMPVVTNRMIKFEGDVAKAGYWVTNFFDCIFWAAIILGVIRILLLGILASINKLKSNFKKSNVSIIRNITLPPVSIIIPAYNEEINIVRTIQNLLNQEYPNFEIIFVDDGSNDFTYKNVVNNFSNHPLVKIITKENGGKASALNLGIANSENDFLICIDADTLLKSNAILKLMECFFVNSIFCKKIGAVAGIVKVGNERNMLTKWQSIEYITSQNFERRAFELINGITVVPGAIGAFSKDAILKAGGFTDDTLAEDCDLTIRILKNNFKIINCAEAIAITEAPETLSQFMKQRFRWSYGIIQSFWKNRKACFNPKYKSLGMIALPNILIFQIILPLIAPLADLMLIVGLIWNRNDSISMHKIGNYYLFFFAIDLMVSIVAFIFEKEKLNRLIWLIPQRVIYRQLMYIIIFKSIRKAIKGDIQNWDALRRTGNMKDINSILINT